MAGVKFPLDSMSYTNKDFQTIYIELLDLAKKLSYRWDPTISNESDPGVVLLKLNAIIADKNNYNIDKNILETFPSTVSQDDIAYNLFDQLGYRMQWYKAASSNIYLKWILDTPAFEDGVGNQNLIIIPRFSMFCDEEKKIVYTTTEDAQIDTTSKGDTTIPALQGIYQQYTVNGDSKISISNIDEDRRIYLNDYNVAQNGIFIWNIVPEGSDRTYWTQVNNISTQELNQRVYEFGINKFNGTCYIEFPEDIDLLIGSGLQIGYIKTDGIDGNIAASVINQIYTPIIISNEDSTNPKTITLSEENIQVRNNASGLGGANPETISSAYKNYKKVKGTFDTLVTLRDYINFIYELNAVSNDFVCDRTNDIQDSWKIITSVNDVTTYNHQVELDTSGNPKLSAFDLKLYLLNNYVEASDPKDYYKNYDNSFEPVLDNDIIDLIKGDISASKCISHDYKDIEYDRPIYFKNKYIVSCEILPQYTITETQEKDIRNNIVKNLCNNLNAREIEFGEKISYDDVYNYIIDSDERIKTVILNNINYTTYAVVYDSSENKFKEYPINLDDNKQFSSDTTTREIQEEIYAKSVLAGTTPLLELGTDIDIDITNNEEEYIDDVESITTNSTITMHEANNSNWTSEYEIHANESIQLYCPELLDAAEFSLYAKWILFKGNDNNLTLTIPRNTDHQLENDEKLVIFWQAEDGDDIPYSYRVYENGDIINASFNLKTNPSYDGDNYGEGLTGSGTLNPSSDIQKNIKAILDQVLSGTKSIKYKEIASVKLPDTISSKKYKVTWILNNKDNVLFTGNDYNISAGSYVLNNGEYFIYSPVSTPYPEILGPGTKISWTQGIYAKTSVDKISLDDLQESGENFFNDNNKTYYQVLNLDTTHYITLTSMDLLTLGEGTRFKVEKTTTDANGFYIDKDGCYSSMNPKTPITDTSSYNFSYFTPDSSAATIIEGKSSESICWQLRSNLAINCGPDLPQNLFYEEYNSNSNKAGCSQSFAITQKDNTTPTTTITTDTSNLESPFSILASYYLSLNGGQDCDVRVYSGETNIINYPTFYIFKNNIVNDDIIVTVDKKLINFYNTTTKQSFENIKLPKQNYLLPLHNSYAKQNESERKITGIFVDKEFYYNFTSHVVESEEQNNHYFNVGVGQNLVVYKLKIGDLEYQVSTNNPIPNVSCRFLPDSPFISGQIQFAEGDINFVAGATVYYTTTDPIKSNLIPIGGTEKEVTNQSGSEINIYNDNINYKTNGISRLTVTTSDVTTEYAIVITHDDNNDVLNNFDSNINVCAAYVNGSDYIEKLYFRNNTLNSSTVRYYIGTRNLINTATSYLYNHDLGIKYDLSFLINRKVVDNTTVSETISLTLDNLFSFVEKKPPFDLESILPIITKYDPDNVYDYTYVVPEDVLIEDPLDPNSFLNEAHIFNKFTLCEMDKLSVEAEDKSIVNFIRIIKRAR